MLCTIPTHNTLPRNCTTIDNIINSTFTATVTFRLSRRDCINKRLDDIRHCSHPRAYKQTIVVLSLRPPPTSAIGFYSAQRNNNNTHVAETLISYRAVELGEPSEYNPCLCATLCKKPPFQRARRLTLQLTTADSDSLIPSSPGFGFVVIALLFSHSRSLTL